MAKGDRIGNRKTREQRRTIKVPELGYYCRLPRLLTQQGLTTIERVNNAG